MSTTLGLRPGVLGSQSPEASRVAPRLAAVGDTFAFAQHGASLRMGRGPGGSGHSQDQAVIRC